MERGQFISRFCKLPFCGAFVVGVFFEVGLAVFAFIGLPSLIFLGVAAGRGVGVAAVVVVSGIATVLVFALLLSVTVFAFIFSIGIVVAFAAVVVGAVVVVVPVSLDDSSLSVEGKSLTIIDYKDYLNKFINQEDRSDVGGVPSHVFRTPDNNFGLYPYPDKTYSLKFEYYIYTTALSAATDVPTIPSQYRQVIVDGATAFGYQYRGEGNEYQLNFVRFEDGIKSMQTLLSNRTDYIRSTVIYKSSVGSSLV